MLGTKSRKPVLSFPLTTNRFFVDSEKDLLQVIVGLHRQLIYASLSSKLDTEEESNVGQEPFSKTIRRSCLPMDGP